MSSDGKKSSTSSLKSSISNLTENEEKSPKKSFGRLRKMSAKWTFPASNASESYKDVSDGLRKSYR